MELKNYIADVPDFPKAGILFKDITPLMQDGEALKATMERFISYAKEKGANLIVGPEARGFLFGTPVAAMMGLGFVPVRKPGKLPREVIEYEYELEYGSNKLCIHVDAIKKGQKIVIVDDLLATGGTVEAAIKLVEKLGGIVMGCAFLIELNALKGREKLKKYDVYSLIQY